MRAILIGLAALSLAAAARAEPTGAVIPAAITPSASRAFYSCAIWTDLNARPRYTPEAAALKGASGVRRRGDHLWVDGIDNLNITTSDPIETEWSQYVGRLTNSPVDVVLVHPYEGLQWVLIDRVWRLSINARGLPAASPDGLRLATAASDPALDKTGIHLFQRSRDGFLELHGAVDARYPCDLNWVSNDRLEFKVALPEPDGAPPSRWRPAALVRLNGLWTYQPPPEERR